MAKNGNKRRMVSRPSSSAQAAERPGILFQLAGLDSAYSDLLRTVFEHMAEEEKKRLAADERFCERVQTLDFFRNGNPDEPLLQARPPQRPLSGTDDGDGRLGCLRRENFLLQKGKVQIKVAEKR